MPDEFQSYGIIHHADADLATADALVGERISPLPENALVGSAALFSTAPYKPPRHEREWFGCVGRDSKCRARPVTGTNACWFHTPKESGEPAATA